MDTSEVPSYVSRKELGNHETLSVYSRQYQASTPVFAFLLFIKSLLLDVAGIHMHSFCILGKERLKLEEVLS